MDTHRRELRALLNHRNCGVDVDLAHFEVLGFNLRVV